MFLYYVVLLRLQQMSLAITYNNFLRSKSSILGTCRINVDVDGIDNDDDDGDCTFVATPLQRSEIMYLKH
jgi:hypothetical protein